jgi:hypothetical protein
MIWIFANLNSLVPLYSTENQETRCLGLEPGIEGIREGTARRMTKIRQHR